MPIAPLQRDLFGRRVSGSIVHTCQQQPAPGAAWRRALRRRWPTLSLAIAASLLAGVAYLACVQPGYQADASVEASVLTTARVPLLPAQASTTSEELAARSVVGDALAGMGTQAGVLLAPPVRTPAWLVQHWPEPHSLAERIAAARQRLRIAGAPDSRVIRLSFTAPRPHLAVAFLRRLIASFDQHQAAAARALAMSKVNFLQQQVGAAREGVARASAAVSAVAKQQGLSDPAHQMQVASQRWQQLAQAETSAEVDALQKAATLAHDAPAGPADSSYATQGIPKDLLTQRATLAATVAQLAAKYRPQALPLRQASHQLAALDANIAGLRHTRQQRQASAMAAVEQQVQGLRGALARQRRSQTQLQAALAQFDLAQRGLTARQQEYSALLGELQKSIRAVGAQPPALQISDPPMALPRPLFPRPAAALATALLLGLALGLGAAWWRDHADDRLCWPEAEEMGVPVGMLVPRGDIGARAGREACIASLLLAQHDYGAGVVLVTGAQGAAATAELARALAQQLAQHTRSVLLLEAGGSSAAETPAQGVETPGLSELLQGHVSVDDVLRNDGELSVIAAGGRAPSCVALAAGAGEELLRAARSRFSWVLIAGPPILEGVEAGLWSALADCTLVLTRHGSISRRRLRQSLDRLEEAGGRNLALAVAEAPVHACDPARPLWRLQTAGSSEPAVLRMQA